MPEFFLNGTSRALICCACILVFGCQNEPEQLTFGLDETGHQMVTDHQQLMTAKDVESLLSDCDRGRLNNAAYAVRDNVSTVEADLSAHYRSAKLSAKLRLQANLASALEQSGDCKQAQRASERFTTLSRINERNGDHLLKFNVAYHSAEQEQVEKAFRDYGELYVDPTQTSLRLDAEYKAWSGYWYPVSNIESLIGANSPMLKFEKAIRRMNRQGGALEYEQINYSDLDQVDSWEGHCHAWSIASVIFPEPTAPVMLGRQTFSINDIRALYTKAAEATPYAQYGISYRGNFSTDGTYQDIRPEAFHRIIVSQLLSNQPVLVDDDAGPEVWTRPVMGFRAQMSIDPELDNVMRVKAYLGMIKQKNEITEELTGRSDESYMLLEYRLYLGATQPDGSRQVLAGEWVEDSMESHPDTILVPQIDAFKSNNPVINDNRDLIERFYN